MMIHWMVMTNQGVFLVVLCQLPGLAMNSLGSQNSAGSYSIFPDVLYHCLGLIMNTCGNMGITREFFRHFSGSQNSLSLFIITLELRHSALMYMPFFHVYVHDWCPCCCLVSLSMPIANVHAYFSSPCPCPLFMSSVYARYPS
jgi:hypothetical protein